MTKSIADLRAEIAGLELQLSQQLNKKTAKKSYSTIDGKIEFDEKTRKQHLALRSPIISYMLNLPLAVHLSGPFVYGMVVPIFFLDLCLMLYQAVCFRLWKVARINRREYVVVDRQHLAYLNGIEKLNCIYCGYANGVFSFAREIAGRTEEFWCPIKHASRTPQTHAVYEDFIAYGDADAWLDHPARKKPRK